VRLFVAVLPPPHAVAELAAALAPLHRLPGADRLRWTRPADWHLTLAFLGEVGDELRPALAERLARSAHRHRAHTLRLAGGGRFDDQVLWTAASGDEPAEAELLGLARSVRAGARRAGAPADEDHAFRSHLTLARTPRSASVALRPYADALAAFEGTPWQVREIALVVSRPPRSGVPGERPHYETAAVWPLAGAATGAAAGETDPGAGGPGAAG